MDELSGQVNAWARRAKLQRSLWWVFFGLACGLGVALVIAIAARVWPLMGNTLLIVLSIFLVLMGALFALAWPWLRHWRTPTLVWARLFDSQFSLRQRVSTALEVNTGKLSIKSDAIRLRQQQDAVRIAENVDARKFLPLRLSWKAGVASLVLLMGLLVALLLPNPQQQVLEERARFRETLAKQVQQIEQAKQLIQNSQELTEEQKQKALQALNEAKQALQDPNATPEKALAAINDAQSKLDELRDQEAQQRNSDLAQAGASMSPDELTNALANALASQNFEQAAQQMRQLMTSNGKPLTENEVQRVANQLDQLARQVQNSDPAMAQKLREAAQQIREGNNEAAQKSLSEAANSLDKASQTQQADQSLSKAQQQADQVRQSVARESRPAQQSNASNQSQSQQSNDEQVAGPNSSQGQEGAQGQGLAEDSQQPGGEQSQGQAASGAQSTGGEAKGNNAQSGHSEDTGSENSVYAPRRINSQGQQVVLEDGNGQTAPNPNGPKNTAPEGQSSVPYQQVYNEYSKAADEAIKNDEVPPDKRDYVRDYFSSLDPTGNK